MKTIVEPFGTVAIQEFSAALTSDDPVASMLSGTGVPPAIGAWVGAGVGAELLAGEGVGRVLGVEAPEVDRAVGVEPGVSVGPVADPSVPPADDPAGDEVGPADPPVGPPDDPFVSVAPDGAPEDDTPVWVDAV